MSRTYDIVIIGSGIAGSISAAILAKHGLKTLILDAGQHPRFSIGEAMPPRAACSCASSRNASGSPNWPSSPILSRSSGTSDRQPAGSSWHSASPGTLPAWTALPSMSSPLRWTLRRPTCIARTSTSTPCCSRSSTARTPATTRASKDSSSFPRVWPSVSPTAKACKLAMSSARLVRGYPVQLSEIPSQRDARTGVFRLLDLSVITQHFTEALTVQD